MVPNARRSIDEDRDANLRHETDHFPPLNLNDIAQDWEDEFGVFNNNIHKDISEITLNEPITLPQLQMEEIVHVRLKYALLLISFNYLIFIANW